MGTRDDAQALIAKARTAWVEVWTPIRWDYWLTLTWRTERLAAALANEHRLVLGFHSDPYPHAHGLVHLSRARRATFLTADEFRDWLHGYWAHGEVWAQTYDPTKRHPEHGGAIEYLARDPGSVVWG